MSRAVEVCSVGHTVPRKQTEMGLVLSLLSPFHLFIQPWILAHETMLLTVKMNLPSSVKQPHKHIHKCVSQVIINSTRKMNVISSYAFLFFSYYLSNVNNYNINFVN